MIYLGIYSQRMLRFYFFLWLYWVLRVMLCSVFLASTLSFFLIIYVFINQNMPQLTDEVIKAIFQVFSFWFPIFLSLTLLIALFRSLKFIFNHPFAGYELKLLECNSYEQIDIIGYGDLIKVWRKWFMLIIWLVGVQMIIAIVFTNFLSTYDGFLDWFNIYFLALFISFAGYFSFIILSAKCKRVKIIKC